MWYLELSSWVYKICFVFILLMPLFKWGRKFLSNGILANTMLGDILSSELEFGPDEDDEIEGGIWELFKEALIAGGIILVGFLIYLSFALLITLVITLIWPFLLLGLIIGFIFIKLKK